MLSLVSSCNLVASIVSLICIELNANKLNETRKAGSQSRTVLSQKTSGSFGAVKKAADTEFAGGYSAILMLACISASMRFRFLT